VLSDSFDEVIAVDFRPNIADNDIGSPRRERLEQGNTST